MMRQENFYLTPLRFLAKTNVSMRALIFERCDIMTGATAAHRNLLGNKGSVRLAAVSIDSWAIDSGAIGRPTSRLIP